ncbi:ATP-binding protein [Streptomyces sp. NPDC048845]|uniref:ATP-binding protein n=1 Tax=Streptomyces sp. NPDC048845 TaxID=3155390 RepID=UPI00341F9E9E
MTSTPDSPSLPAAPSSPAGVAAVLDGLLQLRDRAAWIVERRSADDPTADDPLRGMYLSPEAIRHRLRAAEAAAPDDVPEAAEVRPAGGGRAAPDDRLLALAVRFGLAELDVDILLAALAPDVDRTFEPLYGYLNDDVSRRRATTGLALDLCGVPAHSPVARARLHPGAPLRSLGLLLVEEEDRPFLSRSLRVTDRVAAHLLGDDGLDAALTGHVRLVAPDAADRERPGAQGRGGPAGPPESLADQLAKQLADGRPLLAYLREHRTGDGLSCALAALRAADRQALLFTPPPAASGDGHHDGHGHHEPAGTPPLAAELLREARLRDCAVVVSALPGHPGPLIRALTAGDVPVLFVGEPPFDPGWSGDSGEVLVFEAPRRQAGAVAAWAGALGLDGEEADGFDLAQVVAPYRLGEEQIRRAARAAAGLAEFEGGPVTARHLRLGARQQTTSGLERHARRIRPAVGWDDLVLPPEPLGQLHELVLRSRHRERVLGEWRLSAGGGRGRGVVGLFAGDSGTGKTLSAEVVAAELGLDLYVVQLSAVVDKYVGETEKNLERIFTEADRVDAVLLFDEADAVFGKRSEVKDSHDRYANMESAYLLQRLESFDGIALLTTNLRANIDEAFTRRLDLVVDFPFPDAEQRLALWRTSLAGVPCAEGLDPGPCAREFELSGGSIRSAVVSAAYAAAGRGDEVTAADLLAGARREYRKAGRLVLEAGHAW